MKVFGMPLGTLHFLNDDHVKHCSKMFEKFPYCNAEYAAASYIAAVPEIFKCFSIEIQGWSI